MSTSSVERHTPCSVGCPQMESTGFILYYYDANSATHFDAYIAIWPTWQMINTMTPTAHGGSMRIRVEHEYGHGEVRAYFNGVMLLQRDRNFYGSTPLGNRVGIYTDHATGTYLGTPHSLDNFRTGGLVDVTLGIPVNLIVANGQHAVTSTNITTTVGWNPTYLSGLTGWWDAQDPTSIVGSPNITAWNDVSGGGHHLISKFTTDAGNDDQRLADGHSLCT